MGGAVVVSSCYERCYGGGRPLTNEEQSLLDLRRVRLPTMESHVRECARHLLVTPSREAEHLRLDTDGVVLDGANYHAAR